MPKDEFDFEDPLELQGVAFLTEEDTSGPMAECFIEEFLRMGYNHKQILALFRNPQYLGMNMVIENKGEPFVRELIAEVFARWGRPLFRSERPPDQPLGPAPLSPKPDHTNPAPSDPSPSPADGESPGEQGRPAHL